MFRVLPGLWAKGQGTGFHPPPPWSTTLYTSCKALFLFPLQEGEGLGLRVNLRTIKRLANTLKPSFVWLRTCVDSECF